MTEQRAVSPAVEIFPDFYSQPEALLSDAQVIELKKKLAFSANPNTNLQVTTCYHIIDRLMAEACGSAFSEDVKAEIAGRAPVNEYERPAVIVKETFDLTTRCFQTLHAALDLPGSEWPEDKTFTPELFARGVIRDEYKREQEIEERGEV